MAGTAGIASNGVVHDLTIAESRSNSSHTHGMSLAPWPAPKVWFTLRGGFVLCALCGRNHGIDGGRFAL